MLAETLEIAQRNRSFISLMMIDVDHFKSFNDTYGHQAGDRCLQELSQAISASLSQSDSLVARYGGEEFAVMLPNHDKTLGLLAAERARLAVQLAVVSNISNSPPRQTISIGLVSCLVGPATTPEMLFSAADAALYEAKRQGRNRVCVYPEGLLQSPSSHG